MGPSIEKSAVEMTKGQPKTFQSDGTKKHVDHWTICIAKQGKYAQKWDMSKYYVIILSKHIQKVWKLSYNAVNLN
jgi:hypothetical protein